MVKLILKINPIVNLFCHLERGSLSGFLRKRYVYAPVEKYRQKALKITERTLLDDFSFLLDQENIHSLIVEAVGKSDSVEEAKGNLVEAVIGFADELAQVMKKSQSDYLQYFQDNITPELEKFEKTFGVLFQKLNEHWLE